MNLEAEHYIGLLIGTPIGLYVNYLIGKKRRGGS